METALHGSIQEVVRQILRENLEQSVEIHGGDQMYLGRSLFNQWKEGTELPKDQWPQLTVAADMVGWLKCSSGCRCDSVSGHAFLLKPKPGNPLLFRTEARFVLFALATRS